MDWSLGGEPGVGGTGERQGEQLPGSGAGSSLPDTIATTFPGALAPHLLAAAWERRSPPLPGTQLTPPSGIPLAPLWNPAHPTLHFHPGREGSGGGQASGSESHTGPVPRFPGSLTVLLPHGAS